MQTIIGEAIFSSINSRIKHNLVMGTLPEIYTALLYELYIVTFLRVA